MTWYKVADHKFGCPMCEGTQTEVELRITRCENRTRSTDGFATDESSEKVTSESECCENCGEDFDQERWEFGRCQSCGSQGFDCELEDHCTRCDQMEGDCECERADCCEDFADECECKESDVKEKDNTIEKAVQTLEKADYGRLETIALALAQRMEIKGLSLDAPTPDKNRVQTPAANWKLPDDLPEE